MVPGYLPEYDPNNQVWYPGTPEYIFRTLLNAPLEVVTPRTDHLYDLYDLHDLYDTSSCRRMEPVQSA